LATLRPLRRDDFLPLDLEDFFDFVLFLEDLLFFDFELLRDFLDFLFFDLFLYVCEVDAFDFFAAA